MKFDDGKLRYDLLDDAAMDEMVAVLSYGAVKYEPNNWRLVEDWFDRYTAAIRRHLSARRRGQVFDPETGFLHAAHIACCVHFLLGIELSLCPEYRASLQERLAGALETARRIRAEREQKADKRPG